MKQKIPYTYLEFKNCPEATQISRSREKAKIYHYLWCVLLFALSLMLAFTGALDAICGVILCPIWFIYLLKFYDKTTDKKIKEALDRMNSNKDGSSKQE